MLLKAITPLMTPQVVLITTMVIYMAVQVGGVSCLMTRSADILSITTAPLATRIVITSLVLPQKNSDWMGNLSCWWKTILGTTRSWTMGTASLSLGTGPWTSQMGMRRVMLPS